MTGRTADGDGYLETWATYATVWASVKPATPGDMQSMERTAGLTQQTAISHVVEVDYRDDLLGKHRLLFGDRKLYIRALANDEERNKTYTLACEERTT
jgi:SPP1 family predicted phage head-tail adaptor